MYSLTYIIAMVLMMGVMVASAPIMLKNTATTQEKVERHHHHINNNNNNNLQQKIRAALSIATSSNLSAASSTLLPPTALSTSTPPLAAAASAGTNNTAMRLRKRHRKRHSIWYDYNNYNENSTMLEWSNPCGGVFDPNAKQSKRPTRKEQKRIYNLLRNTAMHDYNHLNVSHIQDIDISNIEIWWLHNYSYKFLPKLKINSSIALRRWYRNMQTYVASFAYLRRIQLKWDHSKSQRESTTSAELKELLKSSRNMLCELEAAVNKTHPYKARRAGKHIPHITRLEMNKRLKLRTKKRMERTPHDMQEADTIDLKFVKFHYFEYLRNMWVILRKFNKRKGQVAVGNIHKLTGREEEEQQNGNSQFNEVEKPSYGKSQQLSSRGKRRKNSKSKHKLV